MIIPSAADSKDSGHGITYWTAGAGCLRRDWFKRQPHEGLISLGGDRFNEAKCGTLLHKLFELYHGGQIPGPDVALEYQEGNENPEWAEALRLFKFYIKIVRPGSFGTMVGTERHFEHKGDKCLATIGVPWFSGRIDGEFRSPGLAECEAIYDEFKIDLAPNSLYYYDLKHHKAHSSTMVEECHDSLQAHSYMISGRVLRDEPVVGMLFIEVFRHKELRWRDPDPKKADSLVFVQVPYPDAGQAEVMRSHLEWCADMRSRYGDDHPNPARCYDWHRRCEWKDICDRKGAARG